MDYKGHIIFGIGFLLIVSIIDFLFFRFFFDVINLNFFLIYIPLILFSFLLPDIDHRISQPRFIITILLTTMIIYHAFVRDTYFIIILASLLLGIWILPAFPGWGHRGHTHSIIFISIVSFAIFPFIGFKITILFMIGAFSHLASDKCIKIW